MDFREYLKNNNVYFDGGMGTLLQEKGLKPGEYPERWNLTHPSEIVEIHKSYFDVGCNVVTTNTFGANSLKFDDAELEKIIKAAVYNAKMAKDLSSFQSQKFVALDIGPSGKLLKPYGDVDLDELVSVFSKTVKLGVKYGVDIIIIETMNDCYETKAALLAVKENCNLPVIVSNAYGEDGKLMTGATPDAMVALVEGMGADAIGANCSLGPKQLRTVIERMLKKASIPVILMPNAGLPKSVDGRTVFDVTADEFSDEIAALMKKGVRIVGGCCGTTPEYLKSVYDKTCAIKPVPIQDKQLTVVSSYTHAVEFSDSPVLIGERINPTGKTRFKQALIDKDIDYILSEGVNQQEKGVHILDVNVGLPDIDETEILKTSVFELQTVVDLPLQIDTSNVSAMESALRIYNGKPMINSVNGKKESMEAIFPLVKKYGGVVVALTLDEKGIPQTAEGRVLIAKKILKNAEKYGISKKDIIFDPLAMTISADNKAALVTLSSVRTISNELGCQTSLGVSNVSFGLPNRDTVNGLFFSLALENGLSAAIINPYSSEIMKAYYTYKAVKGLDENFSEYLEKIDTFTYEKQVVSMAELQTPQKYSSELQKAVAKGFKEKSAELTRELLKQVDPLEIVNNEIIPALDIVGRGFENKTVYLPQLLMSAEAAKSAFEIIKSFVAGDKKATNKGVFVIATVHGDIHDIGKNIVKLLLQNYGFDVVDLGKDVPPEKIVEKVIECRAPVVGLSALMTTTVPAMEETIRILKEKAPWCKTIVGGAVLTQEYADRIGADRYAKDAMEAVRYAEGLINERG